MLVLHAPPSTTTTIHTTTLLHRSPCTPSTSRNAFFTQHHTSWGRRPCPHPHHLHPTCNAAFADPQSVEAGENYARARQSLVAKEEEVKFTPAYNKYLTRTEINENKIRYWKRILVRDTPQEPMTVWSLMVWLPVFIKYEIIPIQLRYAFWLMLQPFQAPWYRLRKQLVLRGAALDAALSNGTFSRARVLRRWHGKQLVLQDVSYRAGLLRSKLHLPPFTSMDMGTLYFSDQQPAFWGSGVGGATENEALGGIEDDVKLRKLRQRNSQAQKRYQAKQKAKLGDLAQREQMLKQQLEMLQTENARLTRQAALLDSRLRLQAEQLHEQIASLDLFHYGPCLPEFNGDYSQPKMCDHSISLPAPPDLIEAHKDITYEQLMEEYAFCMRTMKMHLDTVDAAPGTPAADAAMAEVLNCVQHVCVIFMAGAMHKPLVIKKLLAAEGISSSWRALEHEPINLVEMMKGCVDALDLSPRHVDHILRLRAQCMHNVTDNLAARRHLIDELHKASHGVPSPASYLTSASMGTNGSEPATSIVPAAAPQWRGQGRALRGGVQLSTSGCCRGRALSVIRTHALITELHINLVENHKFVMCFIEELYNTHLLPRPDIVACTFVKCSPYFPDDLAFATAVGIVHGRLDNAGRPVVVGADVESKQPAQEQQPCSDNTSVAETGQEAGMPSKGGASMGAASMAGASLGVPPSPPLYHWFSASQEMSPVPAVSATVEIDA